MYNRKDAMCDDNIRIQGIDQAKSSRSNIKIIYFCASTNIAVGSNKVNYICGLYMAIFPMNLHGVNSVRILMGVHIKR